MTPHELARSAISHAKTDEPNVRHTTASKRVKYAPGTQFSCRVSCRPRRIIREHRAGTPHEHIRGHTAQAHSTSTQRRVNTGTLDRRLVHDPNKRPVPQHPAPNEPTAPAAAHSPKTPAPKKRRHHELGSSPPASAEPARTAAPPAPHCPHDAPQPPHRAGLRQAKN